MAAPQIFARRTIEEDKKSIKEMEDQLTIEKQQLEAKLKEVQDQQVMMRCPDRRCKVDGCVRLGTILITAISPATNLQTEIDDMYMSRHSNENRVFRIRKMESVQPLYFLCAMHSEQQIEQLGGHEHVDELRRKLIAKID